MRNNDQCKIIQCKITQGGEAMQRKSYEYPKNSNSPEDGPYTPRTYSNDQERRNETTNHQANHTRVERRPRKHDRNIRKHKRTHPHTARVWDTFSIQPGRLSTGHRPPTTKYPIGRSTRRPQPRKLHTYQTKPILHNLQYHLQGWKYDTAKQEKNNHQYDAFARVY